MKVAFCALLPPVAAGILNDIEEVLRESVDNGFMTADRVQQLKQFVNTKYEHICDLKG